MDGLTQSQIKERLVEYGENILDEIKGPNIFQRIRAQVVNPLILLLIAASIISFFIQEAVDGSLILAIVILNTLFGLYQEYKAETALAALKKMTVTKVRVVRDAKETEIESQYLVPGDIVYIEEGSKVSADGIIIQSHSLSFNESALTGESLPVNKQNREMVFSGTIVMHGRGYMTVEQTGMKTKFGAIAKELANVKKEETPLQKKLLGTSRVIGIIGLVLAGIVFVFSLLRGETYFGSFLLAVSLAVAVVPEGLPAVMTITLAIGMGEMAKRKSIVRKLTAIEALGSITVIATDKTGTLTTNKMTVRELLITHTHTADEHFLQQKSSHFEHLLLNGILCSTASLTYAKEKNNWAVLGDPTEGALLSLAQKAGWDYETIRDQWELIAEEPFDSVTKKMSVLAKEKATGKIVLYSKGAPESILATCVSEYKDEKIQPLTIERRKAIEEQLVQWATKGLRVLAFSFANSQEITKQNAMVFVGLVAIHDAPRPEAVTAVKKAQEAGIRVIMITGDNEKTAAAIGTETGIFIHGSEIMTGTQIENYSDEQLLQTLPKVAIFARTSPFQKHRIVQLLQKSGEIVAVTGDGVNDAIALKQANVGIAMGLVGTDVARETADMIITDDNFASIVQAIEEGRTIIKHLKNSIVNLLSCNICEALTIVIGLLLGIPHFLYPIQLLYINLVTDGLPALAIPFSPRDPHIMREKSSRSLVLLGTFELRYILIIGALSTVVVFISYYLFSAVNPDLGKTAAFSVLTLIQSFIFLNLWLGYQSVLKHWKKLLSPIFFAAFLMPFFTQYVIIRVPTIARYFHSISVSLPIFGQFLLLSFAVLFIVEIIHAAQVWRRR